MRAERSVSRISVEDYLRGEEDSQIRHEYLDGQVYAMVGASDRHGLITLNLGSILSNRLPDRCQVFISDMKVRIATARQESFYYPDALVSCDPTDRESHYRQRPCLIAEVLSRATERTDRFEKFFSYRELDSLREYLLIAQDFPQVEIHRRARGWVAEVYTEGELLLESLALTLSLAELYRRVEL